jgi:hypothetical protein
MFVPEITEVKDHFERLKANGIVSAWELPYENLLTRRSAAIFFANVQTDGKESISRLKQELEAYKEFSLRVNTEEKLSKLKYRITFNKEEKEKNEATPA